MVIELKLDDILVLRKPHPCGGLEWQVTRAGADMRIQCTTCDRSIILSRSDLDKKIRKVPG